MSDRWPIHTIVFDLDDTLYLERDFVLSGFAAVDQWLKNERGVSGFAEIAARLFSQGDRGRIFDAALTELRLPTAPEDIAQLVEVYRTHRPAIELLPDAVAALAWATGTFRIALITDGYAGVQRLKIASLKVADHIPCCIVTDELGREFWKPNPAAFRKVMEHFPGSADGYVYIGDNPGKDFIAPHALGWRTVRIRRPHSEHASRDGNMEHRAEREILSLDELPALFCPVAGIPDGPV